MTALCSGYTLQTSKTQPPGKKRRACLFGDLSLPPCPHLLRHPPPLILNIVSFNRVVLHIISYSLRCKTGPPSDDPSSHED